MSTFFVYVDWTTESVSRPFYVGKGKRARLKLTRRNRLHENIRSKYGLERRVVFETDDESEAFRKEMDLIQELKTYYYGGEGFWGANFTLGGEGNSGWIMSLEQRAKMKGRSGPHHSLEQRRKWSEMRRGSKISEEHRRSISRASTGRYHSVGTREMLRKVALEWWKKHKKDPNAQRIDYQLRAVEQIDPKSGLTLDRFESIKDACKFAYASNIVMCCRGRRKSAGGYAWRYAPLQNASSVVEDRSHD